MSHAVGAESATTPFKSETIDADATQPRRWSRAVPKASAWERLGYALLACASLLGLIAGSRLEPAARGHGTHHQWGLPPCGWVIAFDKPCPTCGMTTAVAHATRGEFLRAAIVQPAGAAFALGAACAVFLGLHVALTGSALGSYVARLCFQPRVLWGLLAFAAASWAYKFLTW